MQNEQPTGSSSYNQSTSSSSKVDATLAESKQNRTEKYKKLNSSKAENEKKSNKKKRIKRMYKKKIKECLYDSDDYKNSDLEKREKITKSEHTEIDEESGCIVKKTMFHIHFGVSVPYNNWKEAIKAKSSQGFLREIAVPHIWTLNEFVKKAVQIKRTTDHDDRSELTPRKREAVKRGYVQYLLEHRQISFNTKSYQDKEKREKRIKKYGRELGILICQQRNKFKSMKKATIQDEKHSGSEKDHNSEDTHDCGTTSSNEEDFQQDSNTS